MRRALSSLNLQHVLLSVTCDTISSISHGCRLLSATYKYTHFASSNDLFLRYFASLKFCVNSYNPSPFICESGICRE